MVKGIPDIPWIHLGFQSRKGVHFENRFMNPLELVSEGYITQSINFPSRKFRRRYSMCNWKISFYLLKCNHVFLPSIVSSLYLNILKKFIRKQIYLETHHPKTTVYVFLCCFSAFVHMFAYFHTAFSFCSVFLNFRKLNNTNIFKIANVWFLSMVIRITLPPLWKQAGYKTDTVILR